MRIGEGDEIAVDEALAAVVAQAMPVHAGDMSACGFEDRLSGRGVPFAGEIGRAHV